MGKKARKVSMESSPSAAGYAHGEDARARLRYQYLLQDYEELLKETEAKKRKLQESKQKKPKLLGEVKFLRRRFKSLLQNPSQTNLYRLKKQIHKTPVPSAAIVQPAKLHAPNGVLVKGKNQIVAPAAKPRTSMLLDLNQISLPSGEEMESEMQMEPPRADTLKRCSINGGQNEQKLTICRDVGNNSNRVGKRKIRWQDPVALKV
ncbi:hypothetical protein Cni_G28470 [Canna indica]|uniref:Uncharacterized protein n=1 Tax=Canna indica TaxID=4628 RepID=A0AAQ3L2S3_9LILI|nr:hypothetical protein Cni_G28470 [Canna indica]